MIDFLQKGRLTDGESEDSREGNGNVFHGVMSIYQLPTTNVTLKECKYVPLNAHLKVYGAFLFAYLRRD